MDLVEVSVALEAMGIMEDIWLPPRCGLNAFVRVIFELIYAVVE